MRLHADVLPCTHNFERWEAALVIDGSPTTFTCSHSHQTPQAATKCVQPLVARAEAILADPRFQQVEINDNGLVEWRITASMIPNDPTKYDSIRLHLHRNF